MPDSAPIIDVFCHILPKKYRDALYKKSPPGRYVQDLARMHGTMPVLTDLDLRFRYMDVYPGLREVLSVISPPVELYMGDDAIELARLANDELAELVAYYPGRFLGAFASLPMNNIDAAMKEAERAIEKLKMKGVLLYTPCDGNPLDSPLFFPLYEFLVKHDLPVLLHPTRERDIPDYPGETESKYRAFQSVGWPYETTLAMVRLVFSGVMEKYPLKMITHHCGGMVPYFSNRLSGGGPRLDEAIDLKTELKRPPLEYFKMFYGDTALGNNLAALMCGCAFFGAEHLVFGSDAPHQGYERRIAIIEQMPIPEKDRYLILAGNAARLLHLPQP